MNIIEINRRNLIFTQDCLNILGFVKYWGLDRYKYGKYIARNLEFKNCAQKESCYILGNGPSLRNVELSKLNGKDIITVNKSIKTSVYEKLNPKFHIVIDRFILADIADDIEKELQRVDSHTIFILHRSAIERFGKYERARFIYGTKMISRPSAYRNDMTSNMTTFLNVLPFAVSCAMYMGYKTVVLLGNDFNFFAARKDQHFYDLEEDKERTESLYSDLSGCSIVLIEYRNLYNYAKKCGIEIVNATEGSLLDEIPQVNLEQYL